MGITQSCDGFEKNNDYINFRNNIIRNLKHDKINNVNLNQKGAERLSYLFINYVKQWWNKEIKYLICKDFIQAFVAIATNHKSPNILQNESHIFFNTVACEIPEFYGSINHGYNLLNTLFYLHWENENHKDNLKVIKNILMKLFSQKHISEQIIFGKIGQISLFDGMNSSINDTSPSKNKDSEVQLKETTKQIFNQFNEVIGEIKIKYKETSNQPIKKGKKINFKHSFTIYSIDNIINQIDSEVEQYNEQDLLKFEYTYLKKEDGIQSAGGGQRIDSNSKIMDLGFDKVINDQKSTPVVHPQHFEQTDVEIQREQSEAFKIWQTMKELEKNKLITDGESPKNDASLSSSNENNDKVGEFDETDTSSENDETELLIQEQTDLLKSQFNGGTQKASKKKASKKKKI